MDEASELKRRGAPGSEPRSGHDGCPYFRSAVEGRPLAAPLDRPDPRNRCAALSVAVTPSDRQQELVCLTGSHVSCPRYVRGQAARDPGGVRRPLGRATVAAIAALVLSAAVSLAFVLARGSLALPTAVAEAGRPSATAESPLASPSTAAAVVPGTAASAAATSPPPPPSSPARPAPAPTPAATPAPTPRPTPAPTRAPTPQPTPVPVAPTATVATPQSDRYALLRPCPDAPDCWIYVIRSGDNLFSIASYFGVPLDTVYSLNPWTRTTPLRAGQELVLPPPSR